MSVTLQRCVVTKIIGTRLTGERASLSWNSKKWKFFTCGGWSGDVSTLMDGRAIRTPTPTGVGPWTHVSHLSWGAGNHENHSFGALALTAGRFTPIGQVMYPHELNLHIFSISSATNHTKIYTTSSRLPSLTHPLSSSNKQWQQCKHELRYDFTATNIFYLYLLKKLSLLFKKFQNCFHDIYFSQ